MERWPLMKKAQKEAKEVSEQKNVPILNMSGLHSTNWKLESIVRQIQNFFQYTLCSREDFGGFVVHQRNVWCPYSFWASFLCCANDGFTTMKGDMFTNKMVEERMKQSGEYSSKELYPKRAPKLRSKIVWELHCIWRNETE